MVSHSSHCTLYINAVDTEKRNITDERKALDEVLVRLEKGLSDGNSFLSGKDEPNMGDIAVYGVLRSIEGLPAHKQVLEGRDEFSPLPAWYKRMKMQVGN